MLPNVSRNDSLNRYGSFFRQPNTSNQDGLFKNDSIMPHLMQPTLPLNRIASLASNQTFAKRDSSVSQNFYGTAACMPGITAGKRASLQSGLSVPGLDQPVFKSLSSQSSVMTRRASQRAAAAQEVDYHPPLVGGLGPRPSLSILSESMGLSTPYQPSLPLSQQQLQAPPIKPLAQNNSIHSSSNASSSRASKAFTNVAKKFRPKIVINKAGTMSTESMPTTQTFQGSSIVEQIAPKPAVGGINEKASLGKTDMKREKKLQDKIDKALHQRPEKSNRGRKAEPEDSYIRKSNLQIKAWEKELSANKGKYAQKKYESLYNKMTALKSRVRKKIEKSTANTELDEKHRSFNELSKLLSVAI